MEKLTHLEEIGVTTIWLNPVYSSAQVDNGYDIIDYKMIDPIFGSMNDMDMLITEMHKRGMIFLAGFF